MSPLYRVQNASGLGPYNAEWPHRDAISAAHGDERHPEPHKDFGGGAISGGTYLFAFTSKTAARRWFSGWWRLLRKHGFELVERNDFRGHAHSRSGLQVAFKPIGGVPPVPLREIPF